MEAAKFTAFLCHNSADKPAVAVIARALEDRGVRVWLDRWNLIPGEPFVPKIEEALNSCSAVAVFIGPSGRSPWQNKEMELAINRAAKAVPPLRVIPVLLPLGLRETESSFLNAATWVEFGDSLEDEEAIRLLVCGIKGERPGRSPVEEPPPARRKNPYRGLDCFDLDDALFFVGRDDVTAELVGRASELVRLRNSTRLLGIIGASGTGKSSVARAGLLRNLLDGAIDGYSFLPVILAPGTEPVANLASALGQISPAPLDALKLKAYVEAIRADKQILHLESLAAVGSDPTRAVVVLVDQFEQIFACADEADRTAFIDNLLCAAAAPAPAVLVVLTLRADFYGDCARNQELGSCLQNRHILLGPLSPEHLATAIEEPARRAGGRVEPQLSIALRDDAHGQAGCLPLIQFVLQKLWNACGPVLKFSDYEKMGRLEGALDQHAEDLYNQAFDESQKALARRVLLRLVQPAGSGRYTKLRVRFDDLLPKSDLQAVKSVEEVAGRLAFPGRLITFSTNAAGDRSVELAHEALLQGWTRLRSWLGEDEEFLIWRQRLRVDMEDCRRFQHDPSTLLRGVRLEEALRKQKDRGADLAPDEHDYIERCRRHRDAEKKAAARRRLAIAGQIALSLVAVTLVWIWWSRVSANRELLDKARDLVRRNSPAGVFVALAAFENLGGAGAKSILEEAVQVAGRPLVELGGARIDDLAFSPKGDYIGVAGADRIARLCGPGDAGCTRRLELQAPVLSVAFEAAGTRLAAGSAAGEIRIWSVPDGKEILKLDTAGPGVTALAFARNGRTFAAGSEDGKLTERNSDTGDTVRNLPGHTDRISRIAFSLDGAWIASASADGTARVWHAGTGAEVARIQHADGPVASIDFAGDARLLTATLLGAGYLWKVPYGAQIAKLPAGRPVISAAATPDGAKMVTVDDASFTLWDGKSTSVVLKVVLSKSAGEEVTKLALSPDGRRVSVATSSGNARVYELDDAGLTRAAFARIAQMKTADASGCEPYLGQRGCAAYTRRAAEKATPP